MKPLPGAFTRFMWMLGTIAPPIAAEIAYRLFWYLGRPAPVRPEDMETHSAARVSYLGLNDKRVAVYSWGDGDNVVLLVHGWRSRASRFGALARALQSPDRTVISFDAPGHGASGGRRTSVLEYAAIIHLLHERHGRFELIVGYSFGVLAAFLARRGGVQAGALVAIAGPFDMNYVFSLFVRAVNLPPRASEVLRGYIVRRVLRGDAESWSHFTSTAPHGDAPLLVIHDQADTEVDVAQARLIAGAYQGDTDLVITSGLGHKRILADPSVLQRIVVFATAARTRSAASSPRSLRRS